MHPDAVDDIRQRLAEIYPGLDSSSFGVTGRIMRLARVIEDWRTGHLAQFDLTPADFNVLATIRRRGPDGINPGRLLESLLITSGGLTKRLDRLESAGMIARGPDPEDRRAILIRLTTEGMDVIDRAIPSLLKMEHDLLTGVLDTNGIDRTASLLRRLMVRAG